MPELTPENLIAVCRKSGTWLCRSLAPKFAGRLADREDGEQEAFLAFLQREPGEHPGKTVLRMRHGVASYRRRLCRMPTISRWRRSQRPEQAYNDFIEPDAPAERRPPLASWLGMLPLRHRAMLMAWADGASFRTISMQYDTHPKTVERAVRAAIQFLRWRAWHAGYIGEDGLTAEDRVLFSGPCPEFRPRHFNYPA